MAANSRSPSGTARITMPERFDFSMYCGFMKSCTPLLNNPDVREIEVELSALEYLDSFALDMLMLLKERATAANKSLSLLSPSIPATEELDNHFNGVFSVGHTTATTDHVERRQSPRAAVQGKYPGVLQEPPPSFWHM